MESHIPKDEMVRVFSYLAATPKEIRSAVAHIVDCSLCWELAIGAISALKKTDDLAPKKRGRPPEWRYGDERDALIVLMQIQQEKTVNAIRAKGWWFDLKNLRPRDQRIKVSTVTAIQRREVFEAIIQEARRICAKDSFAAEHLAMSAHLLIDHLPGSDFPAHIKGGLRLSAMTVVANSRRLAGNWAGAFNAITEARQHLLTGSASPSEQADLFSIHGALVCDTGNLEDAFDLFHQAAELYKCACDLKGQAVAKIQRADALYGAGRLIESVEAAKASLDIIKPGWVRLEMIARSIVTESLVALDRIPEAVASYAATKDLFDEMPDELTTLKAIYLEARIIDGLGDARNSERLFKEAIEGVTEMEIYRLSFVWRFSYFESLFKRNALTKAASLCQESINLLQTIDRVHPQMSKVWQDLLAAVQSQALLKYHLITMRDYLVRHWAYPAAQAPRFTES